MLAIASKPPGDWDSSHPRWANAIASVVSNSWFCAFCKFCALSKTEIVL